MKELTVFEHNHVDVVDSRQVAEMIGKTHAHLMRDIQGYVEILKKSIESKFGFNDFFIESTYKDSIGRTLPCYLLTKKGCDMVANKMTGEKGVLFTAAYVTAFEAMRHHIEGEGKQIGDKPMTAYQQMMVETRQKNAQIREAQIYTRMAQRYKGTDFEQVLNAHATKCLSGGVSDPAAGSRRKAAVCR